MHSNAIWVQVFFYHMDVKKGYFVDQNPLEIVLSPPHYIIWHLCRLTFINQANSQSVRLLTMSSKKRDTRAKNWNHWGQKMEKSASFLASSDNKSYKNDWTNTMLINILKQKIPQHTRLNSFNLWNVKKGNLK